MQSESASEHSRKGIVVKPSIHRCRKFQWIQLLLYLVGGGLFSVRDAMWTGFGIVILVIAFLLVFPIMETGRCPKCGEYYVREDSMWRTVPLLKIFFGLSVRCKKCGYSESFYKEGKECDKR